MLRSSPAVELIWIYATKRYNHDTKVERLRKTCHRTEYIETKSTRTALRHTKPENNRSISYHKLAPDTIVVIIATGLL